jgi:hypothetical protein
MGNPNVIVILWFDDHFVKTFTLHVMIIDVFFNYLSFYSNVIITDKYTSCLIETLFAFCKPS